MKWSWNSRKKHKRKKKKAGHSTLYLFAKVFLITLVALSPLLFIKSITAPTRPTETEQFYNPANLTRLARNPEQALQRELNQIFYRKSISPEDSLRGIYVTASTFLSDRFQPLTDQLLEAGGNMMVIDIEIGGGKLLFKPKDKDLRQVNEGEVAYSRIRQKILDLQRQGIYTVARQVIFNDPYTAAIKPEWRMKHSYGELYDGRWLDPTHPAVQEYNLKILKEVIGLGFEEVQFDYIRFPADSDPTLRFHQDRENLERWVVIADFLKRAKAITSFYGTQLGIDVFGATIWGPVDWPIVGQNIPEIAKTVDVIYPMTYPSHVSPGYYGFEDPYGQPYYFILESIRKFVEAADGHAEIRTWIQGFPLRIPDYGSWFVKDQVRATYDAGANDFVIWSPGNIYTLSWSSLGLTPEKEAVAKEIEEE
jgi:hypothetical protein